ncbi:MAG: hypothetical protein J0I21_11435 [Alphaproteobacteria bacterium]|nr:hypothetical protein [Alphaproteobacteria bacterium]
MTARMRPEALLDAAALQQIAKNAQLTITAPSNRLPDIQEKIAAALRGYVDAKDLAKRQPKIGETAHTARKVAAAARNMLAVLDAAGSGPGGIIGLLNADPARSMPDVEDEIALDSGEARADAARAAMLAEAGLRLDVQSPFGVDDVARVATAALQQLAKLAEAAANRNAMVLPIGNQDAAAALLLDALRDAFTALHRREYTVSNRQDHANGGRPSGKAMDWTLALLEHAAKRAGGTECEVVLRNLVERFARHPNALAKRIRASAERERKTHPQRRYFYRLAATGVKSS